MINIGIPKNKKSLIYQKQGQVIVKVYLIFLRSYSIFYLPFNFLFNPQIITWFY